jgi:hypothetical protein
VLEPSPRASEYLHRKAKAGHYTTEFGEGDGYMLACAAWIETDPVG